jgi:hypothetical protein
MMMIGVGTKSLVVYLPMLEWLPRFRLNGSALPLSGPSPVSVSLGAFFFLTFYISRVFNIFFLQGGVVDVRKGDVLAFLLYESNESKEEKENSLLLGVLRA